MRKYVVTFIASDDVVDPDFSVDDDVKALESGMLTVHDLMSSVETGEITVSYSVVEEKD